MNFEVLKTNFEKEVNKFLKSEEELANTILRYKEDAEKGKLKERELFINYIKTRLQEEILVTRDAEVVYGITVGADNIDKFIDFEEPSNLSALEKFEILLYHFKEIDEMGYDKAFKKLKEKYPIYLKVKEAVHFGINKTYEYTEEDINKIYESEKILLSYSDKLDILTQKVYEEVFGLGCIDILAFSDINEVGISNDGSYIYCWADEKIRLSFLNITENECRQIQERSTSFDNKNGQISTSTPEINCDRADQARITAFQKPYFSTRHLRIRIFNKKKSNFNEIITSTKQQLLIQTLISIGEKGVLQGPMGVGKTTSMQTFNEVIQDYLHIGSVEDYFEQHNSIKYPNKCIVEAQTIEEKKTDTKTIPGKNLLDAIKSLLRASVDVLNIGEARDGEAVFAFIQVAQALANCSLFTVHAPRPEDTIPRLKNMIIATGKYFSEQAAVKDLVTYVNTIYQHSIIDNQRCISDIVEVVPLIEKYAKQEISSNTDIETLQKLALVQQIQQNTSYMYTLKPLLVYKNGDFVFQNRPSERLINKANENIETKEMMDELLKLVDKDLRGL